ncbi:sec23 sec24 trunk domain containing protein [Stylonychia lemnae]|uniref:Sec23 sec24 trunk domain containing protein n=1 Tax=Stylonychia lemnae TaxID=5949 RepID=A0A077ZQN2_STYLE|nr:sec23 sec24 trunk domain containing protein [Stylonychia lemnae]|eukprot:CDW72217.1 sec23 sec24 trunk domain containing protein [Stylonychia lemnae]
MVQNKNNQDYVGTTQKDIGTHIIDQINSANSQQYYPLAYETDSKLIPPSPSEIFTQIDNSQTGPKLLRATAIKLPQDQSFIDQTCTPFGILVQPLTDLSYDRQVDENNCEVNEYMPVIDCYDSQILRCPRCLCYINPFFKFIENGQSVICNICQYQFQCPEYYYSQLNEMGLRRDLKQRFELHKGSYEFIAPRIFYDKKEYKPDEYVLNKIFVIDVSPFSVQLGLFEQAIYSIKLTLDYMEQEHTKISILTFDANVHLYQPSKINPNGEPLIYIMANSEEPFLPIPQQQLLLHIRDQRQTIDYILDKILVLYTNQANQVTTQRHVAGAALKVAELISENQQGNIILFSANMPNTGVGKFLTRDDSSLYNTDKEPTLLKPFIDYYTLQGQNLNKNGVCLETGAITQARIDSDKVLGIELQLDKNQLKNFTEHYLQFAILFNNIQGQKRIRVLNYRITAANSFSQYLESIDQETLGQFVIRSQLCQVQNTGLKQVKQNLLRSMSTLTKTYITEIKGNAPLYSQEIPQQLAIFAGYINRVLRSKVQIYLFFTNIRLYVCFLTIRYTILHRMDKEFQICLCRNFAISLILEYIAQTIYKLKQFQRLTNYQAYEQIEDQGQQIVKPLCQRTALQLLNQENMYIFDDGEYIYLYVGERLDSYLIQQFFGYDHFAELRNSQIKTFYPQEHLYYSMKLSELIETLKYEKSCGYQQPVQLIFKMSLEFEVMKQDIMVEDVYDTTTDFSLKQFEDIIKQEINKISKK